MQDREGRLIVSEPLDDVRDGWCEVPPQRLITVTPSGIETVAMPVVSSLEKLA